MIQCISGTKSKYAKQSPKELDLPLHDAELFASQISDMATHLT